MPWTLSHRADWRALPLADRHYNRQKIGSPQFVPPGRCCVLLTPAANALWVTSWPFAEFTKHEWAGAWVCSCFRNESAFKAFADSYRRGAPMKPAKKYTSEADLCADFIAWAERNGGRCFSEWAGWDIVVVLDDGLQIGVQAKLRLSDYVMIQALPGLWEGDSAESGPDIRAILVPTAPADRAIIAARLGLLVFDAKSFDGKGFYIDGRQFDWSPAKRLKIPETSTDSVAGSPSPITLTHWKRAALEVLAEIEVRGSITAKTMRELGVNPSRWMSCCWLVKADERGYWKRGEKCPAFDKQHPSAYQLALSRRQTSLTRS